MEHRGHGHSARARTLNPKPLNLLTSWKTPRLSVGNATFEHSRGKLSSARFSIWAFWIGHFSDYVAFLCFGKSSLCNSRSAISLDACRNFVSRFVRRTRRCCCCCFVRYRRHHLPTTKFFSSLHFPPQITRIICNFFLQKFWQSANPVVFSLFLGFLSSGFSAICELQLAFTATDNTCNVQLLSSKKSAICEPCCLQFVSAVSLLSLFSNLLFSVCFCVQQIVLSSQFCVVAMLTFVLHLIYFYSNEFFVFLPAIAF
jgi:hypothetical protein